MVQRAVAARRHPIQRLILFASDAIAKFYYFCQSQQELRDPADLW